MNIFGMEDEDGLFLDFWVLIKYKKKDDDVKKIIFDYFWLNFFLK